MNTIKLLFNLLLFHIAFYSAAQNFRPFDFHVRYQFENASKDTITSLMSESFQIINNDRVLMFNPIFSEENPSSNRGKIDSNNVFGKYMVMKDNGDYLFVTQEKDTFLIRTKASLTSKWTFSKSKNIQATYARLKDTTVFGNRDSVMVILLSDANTIEISKNYGIIKAISFNSYFSKTPNKILYLNAIPERNLGKFLSDPFLYYDFQIGDVFGYHTVITGINSFRKVRKEIIQRINHGKDSIVYTIKRTVISREGNPFFENGGNTVANAVVTETIVRPATSSSSKHSFSYGINDVYNNNESLHQNNALSWLTNQFSANQNQPLYRATIFKPKGDNIYSMKIESVNNFEGSLGVTFKEGLGWTNFDYSDSRNVHITRTDTLECYVKRGVRFGDCSHFDKILSTDLGDQKMQIHVSPNPINDHVNISFQHGLDQGVSLSIYNSDGRKIYSNHIFTNSSSFTINTSSFEPGVYFIKLDGPDSFVKRFIKY